MSLSILFMCYYITPITTSPLHAHKLHQLVSLQPVVVMWSLDNKNRGAQATQPYDVNFLAYSGGVYNGSGCAYRTANNYQFL